MKKLLTATTALALVGGAAFAEITISGSAEFAFDYDSDPKASEPNADGDRIIPSKHNFNHDFNVEFVGSGTTDGGLTFGGKGVFDNESGSGSSLSEGTVFVSGAFGKITFGDNDSADKLAGGIADIGLNGIGVDDIAEKYGKTANQLRYDHTFGAVSIAVSAGTEPGKAAVPATEWYVADLNHEWHIHRVREFTGDDPEKARTDFRMERVDDLFSINRNLAGVLTDGAETPTVLAGYGYARNDEGDLLYSGTGESKAKILVSDATVDYTQATPGGAITPEGGSEGDNVVDLTAVAGQTINTAFMNYIAAYDLGKDMAVGGEDGNVDMLKAGLIIDNSERGKSADNQYAFGMSFNAGGVTVGIGHDSLENTSVGLGFTTGDIGTNMLYVKGDKGNSVGADVSYAMGASTLTLAYSRYSPDMASDPKQTGMGLGVVHDLGGGASLNAGFGQVDDDKGMSHNKASVGLAFAF